MGVAVEQHGFVTTEDGRSVGVSPAALRAMAHRGDAERVAHGVYRLSLLPHSSWDELMRATLWPRGLGVISHDSALDLWDVCDVSPARIHVTVPASARVRRQIPAGYTVHVRGLGVQDVTRIEGVPVVTLKRAILDGVDRHLDGRLIDQALDAGRATGQLSERDLDEIMSLRADRGRRSGGHTGHETPVSRIAQGD
jgi:predicted transcriptional regulator of viral defense system